MRHRLVSRQEKLQLQTWNITGMDKWRRDGETERMMESWVDEMSYPINW